MTDEIPYTEEQYQITGIDYYEEEAITEVYPSFKAEEILEGMTGEI